MFSKFLNKLTVNNLGLRLYSSVGYYGPTTHKTVEQLSTPPVDNSTRIPNEPGVSYFHNIGKEPLRYTTLGKTLARAADKWPESKAITSLPEKLSLTYSHLLKWADKMAASFMEIGIEKGDRVGIWAPNSITWHIMSHAAARGGFILVAINPMYQKLEIENCIKKVQLKALMISESLGPQNFYGMIHDLAPELDRCQPGHLMSNNLPTLKSLVVMSYDAFPGAFNYTTLLAHANPEAIRKVESEQDLIQPDDAYCMQFTSGTTGDPKAIVISHMALLNSGIISTGYRGFGDVPQKICVQLPFFHVYASSTFVAGATFFGQHLMIPSTRYDPEVIYNSVHSEKCTTVYGTPTMYLDMLRVAAKRGDGPSESLFLATVGGSPCPQGLFQRMISELGFKDIMTGYGMTELSGGCTLFSVKHEPEIDNNVGRVVDHIEIKVVNEYGRAVAIGEQGELCVRGFCNMIGYWNDEAKTKQTIDVNGWLKTGDQVKLLEDGSTIMVGRIKDMIIKGGENVYPKEIEDVLTRHNDILEVQVFGVADDRLGEEVCAAVIPKPGATVTLEKVRSHCEAKLAKYKIPKHLKVVSSYPKTPIGKVQKYKLKEMVDDGTL